MLRKFLVLRRTSTARPKQFRIDRQLSTAREEKEQRASKESDVGMERPSRVMDSRDHKETDEKAGRDESAQPSEQAENDERP